MKSCRIAAKLFLCGAGLISCTMFADEPGTSSCLVRQPYVRYSTIVERQMFGALPPGFDPTVMPNKVAKTISRDEVALDKAQELLAKRIRFSVINVTPEGEAVVGFSDLGESPTTPLHYYLKVGETEDGWEVKAADQKTATMTIVKDGTEVSLRLGEGCRSADAPPVRSRIASKKAGRLHQ